MHETVKTAANGEKAVCMKEKKRGECFARIDSDLVKIDFQDKKISDRMPGIFCGIQNSALFNKISFEGYIIYQIAAKNMKILTNQGKFYKIKNNNTN